MFIFPEWPHWVTIIALAALLLSIWGALFTRLNARMSALPLLYIFQQGTPKPVELPNGARYTRGKLVAKLINGGLGPAYLTDYSLIADGRPLDLSNNDQLLTDLAALFGVDRDTTKVTAFHLNGGITIAKDGDIPCFILKFSVPTIADYRRVVEQLGLIRVHAEYQSMYGDELLFDHSEPPLPPKLPYFWTLKRKPS